MLLSELLVSGDIDEIVLFSELPPRSNLEWHNARLTQEGCEHFLPIMSWPVEKIHNGTQFIPFPAYHVITEGEETLERLVDEFIADKAGYCTQEIYDRYFVE